MKVLAGGSPYEAREDVTPPPAAFLGAPLALLGHNRAALVVFLSFVALPAAYLLVSGQFFDPDSEEASLMRPAGMLALLFGYPFLFLLDRGNIDAVVVLLLGSGLVVARRGRRLGGLLLAASCRTRCQRQAC